MLLDLHQYKYYPYEKELALREIEALFMPTNICNNLEDNNTITIDQPTDLNHIERLVYFSKARFGANIIPTLQSKLETTVKGGNRQSTRYSVHGLHEYKGKFNPQIVRAILNILGISHNANILDPFCGSGTSLVECAHAGIKAVGLDINPLAVYVANAKLLALQCPTTQLKETLNHILKSFRSSNTNKHMVCPNNDRLDYLTKWFDKCILSDIEKLRLAILSSCKNEASVFLTIASNLLREYSMQDPLDLRIRKRKTPLPSTPFIEAFVGASEDLFSRLSGIQKMLKEKITIGRAVLSDSRNERSMISELGNVKYDCALTSPPYATALPYIDTQRLSLVWLDIVPPSQLTMLESKLIGSREIRGVTKKELLLDLTSNRHNIPKEQAEYCLMLQSAINSKDGFRRQAVPLLLYRYFIDMAKTFSFVNSCLKRTSPFALVVGKNHTILGGQRFDIDTPSHLVNIACNYGWTHQETIPLQTYHRYGYHMNNAVTSEALIVLRAQQ